MSRTQHKVFVVSVGANPDADGAKMAQQTKDLLQFFRGKCVQIKKMGVGLKVVNVPLDALRKDAKVRNALKSKGITSLPALLTGVKTYFGSKSIIQIYLDNLADFRRRSGSSGVG